MNQFSTKGRIDGDIVPNPSGELITDEPIIEQKM
jgi:hypothetical protein